MLPFGYHNSDVSTVKHIPTEETRQKIAQYLIDFTVQFKRKIST